MCNFRFLRFDQNYGQISTNKNFKSSSFTWRTKSTKCCLDSNVHRFLELKGQFKIITGNVDKRNNSAVQISPGHFARTNNSFRKFAKLRTNIFIVYSFSCITLLLVYPPKRHALHSRGHSERSCALFVKISGMWVNEKHILRLTLGCEQSNSVIAPNCD